MDGAESIARQVMQCLREHVAPGVPIVVAVSGGMDSMALLTVLHTVGEWPVIVAHLDHGLRTDSREDARFVGEYAEKLGYRYVTERTEVVRMKGASSSLEAAARDARYSFLRNVKSEHSARWIVTAHTRTDQVETVLLNLARGSGLRGLRGMSAQREDILRPFLSVDREQIAVYVEDHDVPYRHDSTNDELHYMRNFIRHRIVPQLHQVNDRFAEHVATSASLMGDTDRFLSECAVRWIDTHVLDGSFEATAFVDLDPVLQRQILAVLYEQAYGSRIGLTSLLIESIREWTTTAGSGSSRAFGRSRYVYRDYQRIALVSSRDSAGDERRRELPIPGSAQWGSVVIQAVERSKMRYTPTVAVLDRDAVAPCLYIRSVRSGDRFMPQGMQGHMKVHDYFINQKVPRRERSRVPIVVTAQDDIVWIAGYRVSERYCARSDTSRQLVLSCT